MRPGAVTLVLDEEHLHSLPIAFVDAYGHMLDIQDMQDMQPLDTMPHVSAEPARYALEVNQGFFAERGIQVGDEVELPPLRGDQVSF